MTAFGAEYRVIPVSALHRETGVAALLQTVERRAPVIPAPGSLTKVSAQCSGVPYLGRGDGFDGLREREVARGGVRMARYLGEGEP